MEEFVQSDSELMAITPAKLDLVASMIESSERLVVFTGAGISTESGIPD